MNGADAAATRFVAPAKLNLFLHVVGRRADGYHLIQSVMRLIDLVDDITIAPRADGRIVRDGDVAGVPEDDDLAIRAARLLKAAAGVDAGATIGVHKRIPMGGGLGGGSSDAATVLLALNRLWRLDWSKARLQALGLQLGADVPFFLVGTSALAEGIGERLTPIALPDAHYAVVHPGIAVPTKAIFGAPELTRDTEVIKILDFSKNGSGAIGGLPAAVGSLTLRNDLEAVAVARFDAVREALEWLSHDRRAGDEERGDWPGAIGPARMSGSGACVFRAFDGAEHAAACIAALPARWTGWAVRGLAEHPHAGLAAA